MRVCVRVCVCLRVWCVCLCMRACVYLFVALCACVYLYACIYGRVRMLASVFLHAFIGVCMRKIEAYIHKIQTFLNLVDDAQCQNFD